MHPARGPRCGGVDPRSLVEARLQLHYAAQLAAALGASWIAPAPDDGHPNLGWREDLGALVGHRLDGRRRIAAGLRFSDLALILVEETGEILRTRPLPGVGLEAGREWLDEAARALGVDGVDGPIRLPDYALPDHPVGSGAPFSSEHADARMELARWFAGAHAVLVAHTLRNAAASAVRCWPHHFDIATLITVERDTSGESTRSVGIGLSPGDQSYAEPYWYVAPWPHPSDATLPSLGAVGQWHTLGFTAAVLTAGEVVAAGSVEAQRTRVRDFIDTAFAASRHLLDG